jgi:hypothetical protein
MTRMKRAVIVAMTTIVVVMTCFILAQWLSGRAWFPSRDIRPASVNGSVDPAPATETTSPGAPRRFQRSPVLDVSDASGRQGPEAREA